MNIEPRIRLCMMASTLFTPEMVARFGGSVPDIRRQLDDLVRRGVLARARPRRPTSTPFYYRPATPPPTANGADAADAADAADPAPVEDSAQCGLDTAAPPGTSFKEA